MMEQITINREITSQQSDKSAIQQVDNIEKPKLRKSTFQISETVLLQLDQVHLRLQLELGKAIAPYKEVIVEEALVRLLEQLPMYQGVWREPRTAAGVRSALEKMYAGWAV
jgi:hypothetical protein